MGGSLAAFFHASLRPGIELILHILQLDKLLSDADLDITGEGHSERQTLMCKVPMGVLKRAHKAEVTTLLLSGGIENRETFDDAAFLTAVSTTP